MKKSQGKHISSTYEDLRVEVPYTRETWSNRLIKHDLRIQIQIHKKGNANGQYIYEN